MFPTTFRTGSGSVIETLPWDAYLPSTAGQPDRVVVIAYGSDGLAPAWAPEIVRHAKALTDIGIAVVVPHYLQKKPAIADGRSSAVFEAILSRHGEWEQVVRDAVTSARVPGVTSVGLLGFSLGGFLALRNRDAVDVIVEYFSPYQFPTDLSPPMQAVLRGLGPNANPRLQLLVQHGDADNLVPHLQHAPHIRDDVQNEKGTVRYTVLPGANHGFQGSDAANVDARRKSCDATQAFFKTHF